MHLPCLFYAHCCYMLASERTMLVYFPLMLYIVACFLRLFYLTYRNVPLLWLDGCRSSKHRHHTENSSNFLPLPASVRWHRIFCMCTFLLVVAFLQSFTLGFDFFFRFMVVVGGSRTTSSWRCWTMRCKNYYFGLLWKVLFSCKTLFSPLSWSIRVINLESWFTTWKSMVSLSLILLINSRFMLFLLYSVKERT